MTKDHDAIEELLAGYVLRSLSGEDAEAADRLLVQHVPACPMCRDALQGFQAVAGELALAPVPIAPADLLLPGMRKELHERPAAPRRHFSTWLVAAGVAAVLGMAGWNVMLGVTNSRQQRANGLLADALGIAKRPDASHVLLAHQGSTSGTPITGISAPGIAHIDLIGEDVPPPAPGHAYWVWFGNGTGFVRRGTFEVHPGLMILRITIDPSKFDRILITEEPAGAPPSSPSGAWRWAASLRAG